MCVMERSDGEAELVGQTNERVDVNSLVTMRLNLYTYSFNRYSPQKKDQRQTDLDASSKDLNQRLPLNISREPNLVILALLRVFVIAGAI